MFCNGQISHLNPTENAFQLLKAKLKEKHSKNKQELKTAAVTAWQSITSEEPQCLVMSRGTRFQAVKNVASKY